MKDLVLAEAKRLYDLGFAIHWLHKKSKRPIESGWTTGPRKDWNYLKETYYKGLNVGVRLGTPSRIKNHFLGVIDVDIKSTDKKHHREVTEVLAGLTKDQTLPEVKSGRGNGSRHYHILTSKPLTPSKAFQSSEIVEVFMPSVKPSKKELARLTPEQLEKGIRLRPAWEISIMGEGQQVVLPPSIHPDSGKNYAWQHSFEPKEAAKFNIELLPTDVEKNVGSVEKSNSILKSNETKEVTFEKFEIEPVELSWLPIHDNVRQMILTGQGVTDRSAMLLPIAHALYGAGCTRNEILTVLTDPANYIGQCAYDHAQTKDRNRAAKWVWKYTVKKVFDDHDAEKIFSVPIVDPVPLTETEKIEQQESFDDFIDWRADLDMTDKGKYRATLRNTVMILINAVSKEVVKRDLFSYRDFYSMQTPWGGEPNAALNDDDVTKIKLWIANHFGFEPSANIVGEALTILATNNSFDPVKDALEALPEWDGVERLDTWLAKYFEAEGHPDYLAQVFRKWLVAMVMRTYEPGAKFDWMPIFEGPQGAGKSSLGRLLVGDKYFLDWLPDLSNKDAALSLQGVWAVEMGELASFRKNEIESVKAFITRQVDKVRPPYGQRWLESPRRCVFFGTTNYETYLRDDSGNRRFKPVKVGKLNFEQLEADRLQLFAEALWLYKNGMEYTKPLDIEGDAKNYELQIQSEKMVQDESALMAEAIGHFINDQKKRPESDRFNFTKFSLEKLFENENAFQGTAPLKKWKFDSRNAQFAAKALKAMGGEKRKIMGLMYWKVNI